MILIGFDIEQKDLYDPLFSPSVLVLHLGGNLQQKGERGKDISVHYRCLLMAHLNAFHDRVLGRTQNLRD